MSKDMTNGTAGEVNIIELDRRAVERSVAIVSQLSVDQLDAPTPCAGWVVRDLLAHMIVQHHGFARAADGEVTTPADWTPSLVGDDPVGEYTRAAERAVSAFAGAGVIEHGFVLPEIREGGAFPAATAIGFHFIDYIVHGWDVARSIGVEPGYAPELVTAAMPIALAVPTGPDVRGVPGAAFAPVVDVVDPATAAPLDQILALLGRSPSWPA